MKSLFLAAAAASALATFPDDTTPAAPWFVRDPGALFEWMTAPGGLDLAVDDVVLVLEAYAEDLDAIRGAPRSGDQGHIKEWVEQQRRRFRQRQRARRGSTNRSGAAGDL